MPGELKITPATVRIEDVEVVLGEVRVIGLHADPGDGDVKEVAPDHPECDRWTVQVWGWFADNPAKGRWWTRDLDGYDSRDEAEAEATRVRALAPHLRLTG